tara:strand:- start:41 stop:511 length:471 start_codon:yes stop_codon:yes gene_type:complete
MMSYKERSIWLSLGVLVSLWFNYFYALNELHVMQKLTVEAVNDLLFNVVIFTIILEVMLQIVTAVINNKEANYSADERDQLISLHASRNAYSLLSIGVFLAVFYTVFPTLSSYVFPTMNLPNAYKVMHLIIIFALISEILKFTTQIFYYRRGFIYG